MLHSIGENSELPVRVAIVLSLILVAACDDREAGSRPVDPAWWSLQSIARPLTPSIMDRTTVRTAIDEFIEAKLEANGLAIGPEADRRTLLRRLKFDLHGLPPTPEELDEFTNDRGPDAYERLVDRLLDSPRYGERWARHWLDVVRFAESKGYERDRIRDNAWRYRDWVIRAFNDDMPYRDFVREQLAGDAVHPDDASGAVPTGFLVTGPNNDVGNQSQLELLRERADELDEVVQNVSSVFLGLTVGCARCHDHKFDPIPTNDYYRFAAVFSGVKFGDRPLMAGEEANRLTARIADWDSRLKEINQHLSNIRQDLEALGGLELNVRRNEERFEPVEARFVRLTVTGTRDGTEPCIDEIEVYGADFAEGSDSSRNYALAANGAQASASSLLPGFSIHQVHHLNDGQTGNEHSWISNEKGAGWAQVELPKPIKIARVVWGRDRNGEFTDRLASDYRLEYSLDGETFFGLPTHGDLPPPDPEKAAKIVVLKRDRKKLQEEKKGIEDERASVDKLPKAWAALSTTPVPLKVLKRGDVQLPGEDASPGALSAVRLAASSARSGHNEEAIQRHCSSIAANRSSGDIGISADDPDPIRRLKLADWIADEGNPLTWRVIVNRVWHYHFGAGLVTTPSDFGTAGARPSHPELLDWLADEFRRSGGRFKSLHRMIVRSAVYRQAGVGQSAAHALRGDHAADESINTQLQQKRARAALVDADNRLLWRPNRRRLDAETLRDSILFTSGKLDLSEAGPSYRPFKYIDGNIPVYEPVLESPTLWRRTVYRHVIRTHRQPFLDTFDCPDPSVMTSVRTQTTTPLQALSLLNNPFVIEQSRRFAERIAVETGSDTVGQVRFAFRRTILTEVDGSQLDALAAFVRQHGLDGLCRVLLNTNEFLYVD
jgi:Protein of unknown function (DUF1549)/Protein of unknown function (DUF1553)